MNSTQKPLPGSANLSQPDLFQTAKLTSGASAKFDLTILRDLSSAISLQASEAGPAPCNSPDGQPIDPSGQCPAPASPFHALEKDLGPLTKDTFGPPPSILYASADQQQCSENKSPALKLSEKIQRLSLWRQSLPETKQKSSDLSKRLGMILRKNLSAVGSMEYRQTWSQKATPAGRSYWAHTASARPISDKDCTGWPSPKASNTTGTNPDGTDRTRLDQLPRVAQLAGWASPTAQDHSRGGLPPRPHDTGVPLSQMVALLSGPPSTSSPAGTEKRGALNPAHSRWLMGYPPEWCMAAIRAYRKSKPRRRAA